MVRTASNSRKYKFCVYLLLMVMVLSMPRYAVGANLSSSYEVLKSYPESQEFIDRMLTGGATEAQLQAFLASLDTVLSESDDLTEANFNSKMFAALKEVLLWKSNRNVYIVLSEEFADEIASLMLTGVLDGSLVPLRNAVMNYMLYGSTDNNNNKGGASGGLPSVAAKTAADAMRENINQQIKAGSAVIELDFSRHLTLSAEMLTLIKNADKALYLTDGNIRICIPPGAIDTGSNGELVFSAQELDNSSAQSCLKDLSPQQELIGKVYELYASTESSLSSVKFQDDLTVVISLTGYDWDNFDKNKLLDVFYYNESKKTWEPLSGEIDRKNQTATFKTKHFSKYAVLACEEEQTTVPNVSIGDFADLNGHWAKDKVMNLAKLGIISGVSSTEFAPQRQVTRAEFATMLVKAIKLEPGIQLRSNFNDVMADAWYFSAVNAAADAGLINGYGSFRFGPDDSITREQMAVMIHKAMIYTGKETALTEVDIQNQLAVFSDRDRLSSWASNSVAAVLNQEIITGRGNGILAPRDNATRAEAAVIIMQMLDKIGC